MKKSHERWKQDSQGYFETLKVSQNTHPTAASVCMTERFGWRDVSRVPSCAGSERRPGTFWVRTALADWHLFPAVSFRVILFTGTLCMHRP